MTTLTDALIATREAEFQRAGRILLRKPLLHAGGRDAEEFLLVRRHAAPLREWFQRNTGWRVHVDGEIARLVKQPAETGDTTHPARDVRTKDPFGRRRYVLFCLALACLERADAQITLGRLAEQVVLAAADPALVEAGVAFTLESRAERSDLVAVARLLLDLGVLTRVAGDEEAFLQRTGDTLYDVERRILATLLATPHGPSTVAVESFDERLAGVAAELPPTTDDQRNQRIRHGLTRRLLDDPVLYYDELDDEERTYLAGQRGAIIARIRELTGLVAEVRAEGIAMVDPFDDLTDVRMPEVGTIGHATLLLADHLVAHAADDVSVAELHDKLRLLAQQHRAYWRKSALEQGAEVELVREAIDRLTALRLVVREGERVRARPALARYALVDPTITDAGSAAPLIELPVDGAAP